jgi:serine/threonine protein phosphatase PrpC
LSDDVASGRGQGWSAAGRTDTGLRRSVNQDAFICDPEQGLLAVIDGMGGPAAGEVAAAMTRDALLLGDDLKASLVQANGAILQRAAEHPEERGMGCVATAIRLREGELSLAHVGDTRAYLASPAGCEQLTRDHTVVAEERERLGMTADEARRLPNQHQVTRDVGGQPLDEDGWIDCGSAAVSPGDVLLLCSDGLHDLVRDAELSRLLTAARRPDASLPALVKQLVDLALERGGHDNITVVVARREGAPPTEDTVTLTRPEPPTEETTATSALDTGEVTDTLGGRPPGWVLLLSLFLSIVLAGLGFSVGRLSAPTPEVPAPAPAPGWVTAAEQNEPLVAAGPAGLDGSITGEGTRFTALGPLDAAGWARTEIVDGAIVMLRAAELRFPPGARWQLSVGTGAEAELSQLIVRAPELSWELEVGPGATLIVSDSVVSVGSLRITGAADGVVVLRRTSVTLPGEDDTIEVDGPTLREEGP